LQPASFKRGLMSSTTRWHSHLMAAATKYTNHLSSRSRSLKTSFVMAIELPSELHIASICSWSSHLSTRYSTSCIVQSIHDTISSHFSQSWQKNNYYNLLAYAVVCTYVCRTCYWYRSASKKMTVLFQQRSCVRSTRKIVINNNLENGITFKSGRNTNYTEWHWHT